MKIILLVVAAWFFLSFLGTLFIKKFTKFIKRRRRQQSTRPLSVTMKVRTDRHPVKSSPDAPRRDVIPFPSRGQVRKTSGLQLLTEKYATQLRELETLIADLKRRVAVLTEASRLIEEEGLSKERTTWDKLRE